MVLLVPKPPSSEEVAHEATLFRSKPWCEYCQMGRQVRHRNYLPQDSERESSLVQLDDVFLRATGEQAELQQEAWSAALAVVHVGTGLPCLTSEVNNGAVEVPEYNLLAFLLWICVASRLVVLETSVVGKRGCTN